MKNLIFEAFSLWADRIVLESEVKVTVRLRARVRVRVDLDVIPQRESDCGVGTRGIIFIAVEEINEEARLIPLSHGGAWDCIAARTGPDIFLSVYEGGVLLIRIGSPSDPDEY